jgi:hypothetical protein
VVLLLAAAWHKSKWAYLIGAALLGAAVLFGWRGSGWSRTDTWLLRYPFINYWLFMLIPKLAAVGASRFTEILYRIVPMFSMAALAWSFQRNIAERAGPSAILWGLGVATIPLVFYYSSILYLEPLAVLLMFTACLQLGPLLRADFAALRKMPAWYALLLVGFIKETTVVFVLCFVACRLVTQLRLQRAEAWRDGNAAKSGPAANRRGSARWILGEIQVLVATTLPIGLYFLLRTSLAHVRGFFPNPEALLSLLVYRALGQSFVEQFGLLLIAFAAGCILLWRRRQYNQLLFIGLVVTLLTLSTALDHGGIYAGYSRFNLLILPAILAGSLVAIQELIHRTGGAAAWAAVVLIAGNLLISPVRADGTKVPLWGNYLLDTSEQYYPYREAIGWLHQLPTQGPILFAGADYDYHVDFYTSKLNWSPRYTLRGPFASAGASRWGLHYAGLDDWSQHSTLDQLLSEAGPGGESDIVCAELRSAADAGFRDVVHQVLGHLIPEAEGDKYFRLRKIISNDVHSLMVYSRVRRIPGNAGPGLCAESRAS